MTGDFLTIARSSFALPGSQNTLSAACRELNIRLLERRAEMLVAKLFGN